MDIGSPELIIILVIVVLIFGVGRITKIGGELGTAIREFRHGIQPDAKAVPASGPTEPPASETAAEAVEPPENGA